MGVFVPQYTHPSGGSMALVSFSRLRFFSVLFGTILFAISLFNIVRLWHTPEDIWWTPQAQAVAFPAASNRVDVYIGEERLGPMLSQGRLWAGDLAHSRLVQAQEVRLVFNNRDRVLADRIPALMSFAAGAGAGLAMLLFALLDKSIKPEEPAKVS
jgi:hypothetical protein